MESPYMVSSAIVVSAISLKSESITSQNEYNYLWKEYQFYPFESVFRIR
jgi:hypothetical protein